MFLYDLLYDVARLFKTLSANNIRGANEQIQFLEIRKCLPFLLC